MKCSLSQKEATIWKLVHAEALMKISRECEALVRGSHAEVRGVQAFANARLIQPIWPTGVGQLSCWLLLMKVPVDDLRIVLCMAGRINPSLSDLEVLPKYSQSACSSAA